MDREESDASCPNCLERRPCPSWRVEEAATLRQGFPKLLLNRQVDDLASLVLETHDPHQIGLPSRHDRRETSVPPSRGRLPSVAKRTGKVGWDRALQKPC